jgi:type I restriction enzyme S subunit
MDGRLTDRPLPPGWSWIRLGRIISDVRNGLYKPDEFYGRGTPILKMFNIGRFDGAWRLERVDRVELPPEEIALYRLQAQDLVVNRVNSRELVGKCSVVDERVRGMVFESKNMRVRLDRTKADPSYVAAWLRSHEARSNLGTRLKQIVGQATINRSDLDALPVPLAPLSEQQRIARRLHQALEQVERAQAAAEAQWTAVCRLVPTQTDALFVAPTSRGWPHRTLGEIAEVVGGLQKSPQRVPTRLHRPYLTVRNVQRGRLDLTTVERFEVTREEIERLRLETGDLLIVEGNGSREQIGRNALFVADGDEWVHQNHLIRVRLAPEAAIPEFISSFLNSSAGLRQMVQKAQTTSGLYTLSAGKVSSLTVPLPKLEVQRDIVGRASGFRANVEPALCDVEERCRAIEALPAALLRRAFSGEL